MDDTPFNPLRVTPHRQFLRRALAKAHGAKRRPAERRGTRASGSGAGPDASLRPPPTNRGSVVPRSETGTGTETKPKPGPDTGYDHRPDYVKVTVFADVEQVWSWVESNVLERNGLPLQYVEKGPAGRWASIRDVELPSDGQDAAERRLLVVHAPSNSPVTYCTLELPGQGCKLLGLDGLWGLLLDLERSGMRWRGKRLDYKWDGVEFTPQMIDQANRAGQFVSRNLNITDAEFRLDGLGKSTAYLGLRKSNKTRMLRTYDQHGFNRCEVELREDDADDAMRELLDNEPAEWSRVAVRRLLRTVDYRDVEKDRRHPDRCPRLAWWESFTGNARKLDKLVLTAAPTPPQITPLGRSELNIQTIALRAWATGEAFGAEYLWRRIQHYAAGKITDAHRQLAESLKAYRYSGMAGLGERPEDDAGDEPPF